MTRRSLVAAGALAPVAAGVLALASGCAAGTGEGDPPDAGAVPSDARATADARPTAADAAPATCSQPGGAAEPTIHVVFLVPNDRSPDPEQVAGIERAVLNLRQWYADSSGSGVTFRTSDPVVNIVKAGQAADWFSTNDSGGSESRWFIDNAISQALLDTGASLGDPSARWIVIVDALPGCGQLGRTYRDGVALFNGNDARTFGGEPRISPCSGDTSQESRCSLTGYLGFMVGTSVGLRYPDGCADDDQDTPCDEAWLFNGAYEDFPAATLSPDNQARLGDSAFFDAISLSGCPASCK